MGQPSLEDRGAKHDPQTLHPVADPDPEVNSKCVNFLSQSLVDPQSIEKKHPYI